MILLTFGVLIAVSVIAIGVGFCVIANQEYGIRVRTEEEKK